MGLPWQRVLENRQQSARIRPSGNLNTPRMKWCKWGADKSLRIVTNPREGGEGREGGRNAVVRIRCKHAGEWNEIMKMRWMNAKRERETCVELAEGPHSDGDGPGMRNAVGPAPRRLFLKIQLISLYLFFLFLILLLLLLLFTFCFLLTRPFHHQNGTNVSQYLSTSSVTLFSICSCGSRRSAFLIKI